MTEKNSASVVTSASGTGSLDVGKLSQLEDAQLFSFGYGFRIDSVGGQTINFSVFQGASGGGQGIAPASAVTFNPGDITIWEIGD